jgi:hypothetical protein
MHYHVVVTDARGERPEGEVFRTLTEAERAVPTVIHMIDDPVWSPTRYPGRSARRHEVVVFLDRGHGNPVREVSILRCEAAGESVDPKCHFWGRH